MLKDAGVSWNSGTWFSCSISAFRPKHLEPLPAQHVDTGWEGKGICRVLQQVDSNYSPDLFVPILGKIRGLPEPKTKKVKSEFPMSIADHLRSLSFAIADGAIPSNEGRGLCSTQDAPSCTRFGGFWGWKNPSSTNWWEPFPKYGRSLPELPPKQKQLKR
ncbi:MAG: hypothetical protein Ct9H90mP9_2810 [Pseudomonadota bacterium]|nr:MAG: hypothetical protein Ct9H90mP9_2810 [Pseudomonadota bacterium]